MTSWLLGGLVAWLALRLVRRRYVLIVVRGHSMAPTFCDGQTLLVRRGAVRVGDPVVFRPPLAHPAAPGDPVWRIKRVAALGGQPVPLEVRERVGVEPGALVPDCQLVVRGDAPRSEDSRHFGFVAADAVLGAVVLRSALRVSDAIAQDGAVDALDDAGARLDQ